MSTVPHIRMSAIVAGALVLVATVAALFVAFRDTPARVALAGGSPSNDAFEQRIRWYPGDGTDTFPLSITQSTARATLESGEDAPCAPIGATVWFEYWGDRSGTLTIDASGSDFPAVIAAYSTSRFGTRSGWRRPASPHRSAVAATPTTTPWPRP